MSYIKNCKVKRSKYSVALSFSLLSKWFKQYVIYDKHFAEFFFVLFHLEIIFKISISIFSKLKLSKSNPIFFWISFFRLNSLRFHPAEWVKSTQTKSLSFLSKTLSLRQTIWTWMHKPQWGWYYLEWVPSPSLSLIRSSNKNWMN